MQIYTVTAISLATFCQALAAWLVWHWILPCLKALSQQPLDKLLVRAGQIGFHEARLRSRIFAAEVVILVSLIGLAWSYMGYLLGSTIIIVLYHMRGLLLSWLVETRERLLRRQTLELTHALDGLVRGGLGLADAVESATREIPAPLGVLVSRISNDFRRGRPLVEAMHAVRQSLRLDAFSLLVTSITCALKQGASLEASLAGVQESLEHRDGAERQLRAKTSTGRSTILILACTPPAFALMFGFMWPESTLLLFTTQHGKWMLAIVICCLYIGVAWARRLLCIS